MTVVVFRPYKTCN